MKKTLEDHLSQQYSIVLVPDEDAGGYVIEFPDLPGCMTQIESLDEFQVAADEIRRLWIETQYELGRPIPEPNWHLAPVA